MARSIAPSSAGVHCQRWGESLTYLGSDLGHVEFDESGLPSGPAYLTYEVCHDLSAYWTEGFRARNRPTTAQAVAVHVLSHEAEHLTGITDEAAAECYAMQADARTAEALGATPAQARLLQVTYWNLVYPDMPSDYTSGDCVMGGSLDRSPGDGRWP